MLTGFSYALHMLWLITGLNAMRALEELGILEFIMKKTGDKTTSCLYQVMANIYDVSFTFCFPLDVYLIVAVCQAFQRVRTWNLQAYLSRSPFAFPFAFAQPKCSPPQYEIHSCHTTRVRRL